MIAIKVERKYVNKVWPQIKSYLPFTQWIRQLLCSTYLQSLNILGGAFCIGNPFKDGCVRLRVKKKVKKGLVQG